ncbi:MAG: HTH-type transcriptional activator CmpR [Bacteroidota bacterium]|jgi:DNA-binding transcriptional LysR family regulator
MNYTLNQLRIFLKITQTLSITKSAEQLNLTQPAISIQLKNFQQQFDYPLIEIIQRRIHVTALGKEIALAAESIISEIDNINYRSQNFKNNLAGHLRISIVSTGNYIMPYFLSDFLKKNVNVDLTMDVTNKSKVIQSLLDNEIDFALVSILPDDIQVEKFNLIPNELYLVGNKEVGPNIKIEEQFASTPFIFREKGSGTRQAMEKFIAKNKIKVKKKLELTSNEAVKHAIISGLGYSIMPLIGIRNEIQNGLLKIIPIKGLPLKTTWQLIWLKEKRLTPIAESYLKYLELEKKNIISKFSL